MAKEIKCSKYKSKEVIRWSKRKTENRRFYGHVESAYILIKNYKIFYNFVKKYKSLKDKNLSNVVILNLKFKSVHKRLWSIQKGDRGEL